MVRPLHTSLILPLWCLLLVNSAIATFNNNLEVLRQCVAEGAEATRCTNFNVELRLPNKCLCEGSNTFALATARCLEERGLPIVEAYKIMNETCEESQAHLESLKSTEGELLSVRFRKSNMSLPRRENRIGNRVKRNEKEKTRLSKGALAGIAGGGGILVAALLGICGFCIYRRRSKHHSEPQEMSVTGGAQDSNANPLGHKPELPSDEKDFPLYSQPESSNTTNLFPATSTMPPYVDYRMQQTNPNGPVELPSTTMQTRFEMEGNNSYQRPVEMPTSA